jgi:acetyl-CoA C-acetyltransferase
MYLSRVAAINGGLLAGTPAFTVNRLCGSGLQAIVSAAQAIALGDCDAAVAGGAESMSRGPYWLPGMRWGQRMQDGVAVDATVGALTDPFDRCHMGVTAENVASDFGVSRAEQDELAAESHRRAAAAAQAGHFREQIVPVQVPGRKGTVTVDTDEQVRAGVNADDLAKLKPAFAPNGTVTAGNASGINDAAAAVVLASRHFASQHGLTALGRLVGYAHAGVEPRIMGIGGCQRCVPCWTGLASSSTTSMFSRSTRRSRRRRWPWRANWGCHPTRPIRTAAASPWGIRSERPGPSSP